MPQARLALPLLLAAALLPGCDAARRIVNAPPSPVVGQEGFVRGFLGGVAADEPSAAAAARSILSAGGTAADAAAAAGFALTVTLPSRAGLGGGGACIVYHPRLAQPEAVIFLPGAREGSVAGADRPAAIPLMARGLFALTTRIPGARPFEEVIAPAEQLARFGAPMSRALAADLDAVRGPLFQDPQLRGVLSRPDGSAFPVGERYTMPALAGSLTVLRSVGVGDMYQGGLARRYIEGVASVGGGQISPQELRAALPAVRPAVVIEARGGDRVGVLPLDGGLAAAAGLRALAAGQSPDQASARALAVAAAARRGGGDGAALIDADLPAGVLPNLPASTGVTVFDRNGGAASCVFTMNNLFGTGRVVPGTGIIMAAAPGLGAVQPPLLSAGIVWSPNIRAFRMAAAGSGQAAAPMAVAGPIFAHVWQNRVPEDAVDEFSPPSARAQVAACPEYLPRNPRGCGAAADPRGAGLALGATQ